MAAQEPQRGRIAPKAGAEARFRKTRFNGKAWFGGSEFGRHANFDSILFGAEVRFNDVTFTGAATCSGAYARLDVDDLRIWPSDWLLSTPPTPDAVHLHDMPGRWAACTTGDGP